MINVNNKRTRNEEECCSTNSLILIRNALKILSDDINDDDKQILKKLKIIDFDQVENTINLTNELIDRNFEKEYDIFSTDSIVLHIISFCISDFLLIELYSTPRDFMSLAAVNKVFNEQACFHTLKLTYLHGHYPETPARDKLKYNNNNFNNVKELDCDLNFIARCAYTNIKLKNITSLTLNFAEWTEIGNGVSSYDIQDASYAINIFALFLKRTNLNASEITLKRGRILKGDTYEESREVESKFNEVHEKFISHFKFKNVK